METLKQEKSVLTEKLDRKGPKWQSIDEKFKERKQSLWDLMQVGILSLTDMCKLYKISNTCADSLCDHEKAVLKIDQVFIANRMRSVLFKGEVEH